MLQVTYYSCLSTGMLVDGDGEVIVGRQEMRQSGVFKVQPMLPRPMQAADTTVQLPIKVYRATTATLVHCHPQMWCNNYKIGLLP